MSSPLLPITGKYSDLIYMSKDNSLLSAIYVTLKMAAVNSLNQGYNFLDLTKLINVILCCTKMAAASVETLLMQN